MCAYCNYVLSPLSYLFCCILCEINYTIFGATRHPLMLNFFILTEAVLCTLHQLPSYSIQFTVSDVPCGKLPVRLEKTMTDEFNQINPRHPPGYRHLITRAINLSNI